MHRYIPVLAKNAGFAKTLDTYALHDGEPAEDSVCEDGTPDQV